VQAGILQKNPQYTVEMMKAACDYGLLNSFTIRGSAKLHGVPESTLRRRLGDSRAAEEWKMGAPTYFTMSEESQLAQHCVDIADKGYGYCPNLLRRVLSGTPCNFADPLIVKLFSKP
jgi:hypothetical protein